MPKKKSVTKTTTYIGVVLDKSGSMASLAAEVISGYNQWLAEQQKLTSDDARVSVILFDTAYQVVVANQPVADLQPITAAEYQPGGMTALNDALHRAVRDIDAVMGADDRALVLVITDGQENSSKETTHQQLRALLDSKAALDRWTFTYLSADPNGFAHAASLGIDPGNTAHFDPTQAGVTKGMQAVANSTLSYRGSGMTRSASFYSGATNTPSLLPPKKPETATKAGGWLRSGAA